MASPQKENGYTAIANEILEALCKVNLSAYESRVLWLVLRKTYGYGKKMDRISLSQFEAGTGIKDRHVVRAIKSLLKKQMLLIHRDGSQSVSYGVQKDYEKWLKPLPIRGLPGEGVPKRGIPEQVQPPPSTGSETSTSTGRHKRKKKEDIVRGKKHPSPSNGSDPRIKEFFTWWDSEYRKRFSEPYHFTSGKEGSLIKSLLHNYNLPKLRDLATRFLDTKDPWVRENGGFTIGVFVSQINKLVSTVPASAQPAPKEMPL